MGGLHSACVCVSDGEEGLAGGLPGCRASGHGHGRVDVWATASQREACPDQCARCWLGWGASQAPYLSSMGPCYPIRCSCQAPLLTCSGVRVCVWGEVSIPCSTDPGCPIRCSRQAPLRPPVRSSAKCRAGSPAGQHRRGRMGEQVTGWAGVWAA
eukprot:167265-Chlamydomonas_euryale.AAC.4